jgi:hypothetical protein
MNESERIWEKLCHAESQFYETRMEFTQKIPDNDKVSIFKQGLRKTSQRGTTLRILLILDDSVKRDLFFELVDLASVGHSDIELCREVIKSIHQRDWVVSNIERCVSEILQHGTDEEYRRIAELYLDLDKMLLKKHIHRALRHEDRDVKEVGQDFQKYVAIIIPKKRHEYSIVVT